MDQHNEEDFSSALFLLNLYERCHKIAVNNELIKKYDTHLKRLYVDKSPGAQFFLNVFKKLYALKTIKVNDYNYHLDNEEKIPKDDIYLIKIALGSKGILVTNDEKLIKKLELNNENMSNLFNIRVMNSKMAMNFINNQN